MDRRAHYCQGPRSVCCRIAEGLRPMQNRHYNRDFGNLHIAIRSRADIAILIYHNVFRHNVAYHYQIGALWNILRELSETYNVPNPFMAIMETVSEIFQQMNPRHPRYNHLMRLAMINGSRNWRFM